MTRRGLRLILTGLVFLASACSTGADEESAPTTVPSATTRPPADAGPIPVDWTDTAEVALPNGWIVRDCEGSRPAVCVHDGGEFLGDIELLTGYPLGPGEDDDEPEAVATAWAQRMIDEFRADRATGCPAFTFTPLEVITLTVGGQPGARGGFKLVDDGGRVVEHVINHYAPVDGHMTIINTDAYVTDGGCLPPAPDSPSFAPEDLAELDRGILDRIAAASPITP